jgi:hypothetical protein
MRTAAVNGTARTVYKKSLNRVQESIDTHGRRWTNMKKFRAIQLALVVASAVLFAATNGSGPWP